MTLQTTPTKTNTRPATSWIVFAAAIGFLGGMLVMAAIVAIFPSGAAVVAAPLMQASPKVEVKPTKKEEPSPISPPPTAVAAPPLAVSGDPALKICDSAILTLPVQGIKRDELQDTFNDMRGSSRRHEALDVLAPRNTPILAVEDGTIAKLFVSDAGGMTIYQFDPSSTYCVLLRASRTLRGWLEGRRAVKRGQVIGYVGTTGNAPRDTPHLHFAIFKLAEEKKWWEGTPIDPYSVLK